jgi:hypothetical protein
LRSSLIFSAGDPAPTAQLGRVLIHAQIAGPLSGQTGKHLLILSLSAFDPKADMRRVRLKGNVPQIHLNKTHVNVRHATARMHTRAVV